MSTNNVPELDPEDMFADTRMSIGDHIEDLRTHLLRALKGFMIGMVLGIWPLGQMVLGIITSPVESQLLEFDKRKFEREKAQNREKLRLERASLPPRKNVVYFNKNQILEALGLKPKAEPAGKEAEPQVLDRMMTEVEAMIADLDVMHLSRTEIAKHGNLIEVDIHFADPLAMAEDNQRISLDLRKRQLTTMSITEAFIVYFKVALLTGLVLSSPWVFYHIWMFVAAGLYPNEKRLVNVYLPFSLFLFLCGVLLCQFAVMPRAVGALLWFNEWLGLDADLRLNEWLGFAMMMPLVFGLCFQTPLVMMFVHRIGIMSVQQFREKRRIAWFVMAIIAALITPTPDALTMLFLWVPMGALYELGILLCVYQGEQQTLFDWEEDETKSGDLVEV